MAKFLLVTLLLAGCPLAGHAEIWAVTEGLCSEWNGNWAMQKQSDAKWSGTFQQQLHQAPCTGGVASGSKSGVIIKARWTAQTLGALIHVQALAERMTFI
jgi:hypothetical protein